MSVTEHVTPPGSMTYEEAVARAKDFAPVMWERADRAERERQQPQETIDELTAAGLARLLTPKRWGGYELGIRAFVDAVIEIARADASAGWCYSFLNIHAWLLAHYPDEAQRDVWANTPDVALADSFVPAGKVTRVAGGYRVSGNWPFVSGVDHSLWSMLAGLVFSETGGAPSPHVFLIPRSDYEIEDAWFVAGLRASGSKNVIVRDAFVPEHRVVNLMELAEGHAPGAALNTHPMYRHPLLALFPTALTAPIVGATLGAYETWRETLRTKSTRITSIPLTAFTHLQIRLAETEAEISAARSFLREIVEVASTDGPITLEQRARNHRNFGYLTQLCLRAVERIYLSSGGNANYDSNPLQRYWRDIHAMGSHAAIGFDTAAETFGLLELGLPRNPRDPYL
jgi:3-hydroxy-9,10-secoandrosta-1,3,5(10)-triene-9,17-dione monooxygenase